MQHDVWRTEDGLPQSAIETLLLSVEGYLWMGTQVGLVRFNGTDFHLIDRHGTPAMATSVVTGLVQSPAGVLYFGLNGGGVMALDGYQAHAVTTVPGLGEANVSDLVVDGEGILWIATLEGLYRYDPAEAGPAQRQAAVSSGVLRRLVVGADGVLWLAPRQGGLLPYRPGEPSAGGVLLPERQVSSMLVDERGLLLAGTDAGLYRIAEDGEVSLWGNGLPEHLSVTALLWGEDGALWVGTQESGLWRTSPAGSEHFSREDGLSVDHVTSLVEDPEGSLWIGTHGGGLNRLRVAAIASHPTSLPWVVLEDRAGQLWYGGASGLFRLGERGRFAFPGEAVLDGVVVGSIAEAADGTLWIGTLGEGLRQLEDGRVVRSLDSRTGLPGDRVFSIAQDGSGAIWAGTDGGVVRLRGAETTIFDGDDGLSQAMVRALHLGSDGALWACTDGDGCYHLVGDRFEVVPGSDRLSPPQRLVTSIHEDSSGTLWFSTDGGLLRWAAGRFTGFGEQQGLPEDGFYRVLEDADEKLWLSGNRGVFRVARQELDAVADGRATRAEGLLIGQAQGMRWIECNGGSHPAGWRARDGVLWFPTTGGLVSIDPEQLRPNPHAPPVHIEAMRVGGVPMPLEGIPSLPPGSGRVEFDYAAASFTGPEQVRYRVMLEGLDRSWTEMGNKRLAYYHTLPPGTFRFRVIAANSDGIWNEQGASFVFELRPALHQRWDVRALAAFLVLALGLAVPLVRIRRLEQRKAELEAAVAERTSELRELSLRDPLTGLRNRRFLWEVVPERGASAATSGSVHRRRGDGSGCTGVIMVDLDHFKKVNDQHGHSVGDQLLGAVAQALLASVRADDIVVRWGGEEFLLVLRGASAEALPRFTERMRAAVASIEIVAPTGATVRPTCSAGVCQQPFPGVGGQDLGMAQVIILADAALYRAKQRGRDRAVQVAPGAQPPADEGQLRIMGSDLEQAVSMGLVLLEECGDDS